MREEQKSCGTARFCSEVAHRYYRYATRAPRVTRTGTKGPSGATLSGYIGLHQILYSIQSTATDRRWAMSHSNTPPVRNRALLTTRSSILRCVSVVEHHTAEQYSKTGRSKPRKHLPSSGLSWNTRQDFLKIPSLWEAALETKRRCFSKISLESNVTPNITRSSDSFSTVPPIVNGGDWGCIVGNLETIIILVLLAFNFIPQRSHHSLTLPRSRIRDSATVTLTPGDWHNSHQCRDISITDQLIFQNGKKIRGA